jgi:methyl-accepting chemotaxis protein
MEKLNKFFNIKYWSTVLKNVLFIGIVALGVLSILEGILFYGIMKVKTEYNMIFIMILVCLILNSILSCIIFQVVSKITRSFTDKALKSLEKIQSGDLSFSLGEDEAKKLGNIAVPIKSLLNELREVTQDTYGVSKSIIKYSEDIESSTKEVTEVVEIISETIEEIANGATEQASEAQKGAFLVEKLSDQIDVVFSSCSSAINESEIINQLNKECLDATKVLNVKSSEYEASSQRIFASIENLVNTLNKIGSFAESITNIADQTNLLALNASIEAARAGEQGKGFSVVAEEIRKLADQSKQSVEEINNLLNNIKQDSHNTTEDMKIMKSISVQQKDAVSQNDTSLNKISNAICSIISKINKVNDAVTQMNKDKDYVISAIESISAVTQETAAATEELASTTQTQLDIFETMNETATELNKCSKKMETTLKKYNL